MSKDGMTGYIIAGFGAIGFSVWAFVIAYESYYCAVCSVTDTVISLIMAVFSGMGAIWGFTLPYCFTHRAIDAISRENGKLKFSCKGKSFEIQHLLLKFKLYSEESPEIPTHVFILLRNGPWLCPYALWKDRIESKQPG